METTGWLDLAIAPLTWVERARGRKRLGLIALYVLIALVGGVFAWRELSLWRLPNASEPFDLERLGNVEVPDPDNAMLDYQGAATRLIPPNSAKYRTTPKAWDVSDWSLADPLVRLWVDDNRAILEHWLHGTDRSGSLVIEPWEGKISSPLAPIGALNDLSRLAVLEGSRLEQEGDLEGAWKLYRGVLRSSRHAGMHGGLMQRLVGNSLLLRARPRVEAWAGQPGVTSAMLRRAAADVATCAAMTPPISEAVRCEYFLSLDALSHPEMWKSFGMDGPEGEGVWYNQISFLPPARHFLRREPERSRRVLRLIVAGVLAQCDRPRSLRPKLISEKFMIYAIDGETPPAVRAIPPEELLVWAEGSVLSQFGFAFGRALSRIDFEQGIFDRLILNLSERAYLIDHGRPPRTYGDLLGPYLKALPEGFEPGDAVSAGSDDPEPE